MHKNPAKDIIKPQLAGLIAGTGLIVMIQITGGFMIPVVGSYYGMAIVLFFSIFTRLRRSLCRSLSCSMEKEINLMNLKQLH